MVSFEGVYEITEGLGYMILVAVVPLGYISAGHVFIEVGSQALGRADSSTYFIHIVQPGL